MALRLPPKSQSRMRDGKSAACPFDDSGHGKCEKKTRPLDLVGLIMFGSGISLLSYVLEVFDDHTLAMADILDATGRRAEATALLQEWIEAHPDATDVRAELVRVESGAGPREVARR